MKDKREFSLYNSHLDLAHRLWARLLLPHSWVIDATCGNGKDTAFLAQHIGESGGIIALDIQKEAIEQTKKEVAPSAPLHLFHMSHETFPSLAYKHPIALILYNLGYLPGGDKEVTTQVSSTLKSVHEALLLLKPGGVLSITCYPGHPEGKREEEALLTLSKALHPRDFCVSHLVFSNRSLSPSLILIQKNQL